MILIKAIILLLIFGTTSLLGIQIANKYKNRTKDLINIRNILNIMEAKIKYTYEPLPQIFEEISKQFSESSVSKIFELAKEKMKTLAPGSAWHYAIENSKTYMIDEDLNILKSFEKLLGKTDIEGQINEIELMKKFIDIQIVKAEEEQNKNEKLCKNLGIYLGLALVIILI